MTASEVHAKLRCYNITVPDNITTAELQLTLANYQRTRTLAIWHDHASILGSEYILVTVGVIFDSAVFMSEAEYQAKTGKSLNDIQQIIEEPYIHMIAACSSSAEDQAALIADHFECLSDFCKPLTASRYTMNYAFSKEIHLHSSLSEVLRKVVTTSVEDVGANQA